MAATFFNTVSIVLLNDSLVAGPHTSVSKCTSYKATANVRQTNGQGEHHLNAVPYRPAPGLVAEHDQAAPQKWLRQSQRRAG